MSLTIYYDGDCPFCSSYVRYQRLARIDEINLVNLRALPADDFRHLQERFRLDQGMLVEFSGRWYTGADAMHYLALLSGGSGSLSKALAWVFRYRLLAIILYPILRLFRNLTLLALNRKGLDTAEQKASLLLFSVCFGLFAYLHFLAYAFDYRLPLHVTAYLVPLAGAGLLLRPRSPQLLLLLFMFMVWDGWLMMPVFSNHTIIKNFFLLAVVLAGFYGALRAYSWNSIFDAVAPVGRALLLVMYVFGVFHKINTDFLNPSVSCAVTLWHAMPLLPQWLDTTWFHYLAIYGTLVIETLIFIFLLIPRFRHWGIVFGIAFHSLLAFSGYALYTAFSMLSLTLHMLFLSEHAAQRIVSSPLSKSVADLLASVKGKLLVVSFLLALFLYGHVGMFPVVSLVWCAFVVPLMWLIIKYGHDREDRRGLSIFVSRQWGLNIVSLLFFFNCVTPYLGLKTAQSINMFANLRLEGGVSNHLVLSAPPGPFNYLDDLVSIESRSNDPYFNYIRQEGLSLVWYDFLNRLEKSPNTRVDFLRRGQVYSGQSAATLAHEIESELHPRWFRKWFHFYPVDLTLPKPCARDR